MDTMAAKYVVSIFLFLTIWTWVALFFHRQLYRHIDLLLLGTVVMFIGLYLAHINPKYYIISPDNSHNYDIILNDELSIVLADIIHILPFLIILVLYGRYYASCNCHIPLIRTLCIITIYIILFVPSKVYHVHITELITLGIIAIVIYILFLFILHKSIH
jgi:hypothetical protein